LNDVGIKDGDDDEDEEEVVEEEEVLEEVEEVEENEEEEEEESLFNLIEMDGTVIVDCFSFRFLPLTFGYGIAFLIA
jgi:hypothetical protein